MNHNHLTDETLQAMLLHEIQEDSVAAHLQGCADCRAAGEAYQLLLADLQTITPDAFPFSLTPAVMDTILDYEKRERRKQAWIFRAGLALACMLLACLVLTGIPVILNLLQVVPLYPMVWIAATGLAVFLFLWADLRLQHRRQAQKIMDLPVQPIS